MTMSLLTTEERAEQLLAIRLMPTTTNLALHRQIAEGRAAAAERVGNREHEREQRSLAADLQAEIDRRIAVRGPRGGYEPTLSQGCPSEDPAEVEDVVRSMVGGTLDHLTADDLLAHAQVAGQVIATIAIDRALAS